MDVKIRPKLNSTKTLNTGQSCTTTGPIYGVAQKSKPLPNDHLSAVSLPLSLCIRIRTNSIVM